MSSISKPLVRSKLAALDDTQEGITNVSQWIMFHSRSAEVIVDIWLDTLKNANSAAERLNLLYLANDVAQQSRAKRKEGYLKAYSRVIIPAITVAVQDATTEISGKIKRIVDVWRQRQIFDRDTLQSLGAILEEGKLSREELVILMWHIGSNGPARSKLPLSKTQRPHLPKDMDKLVKTQSELQAAATAASVISSSASSSYSMITDSLSLPAPDKYKQQLMGVSTNLKNALTALEKTQTLRQLIVEQLEQSLALNKASLATDVTSKEKLQSQLAHVTKTMSELDDMISGATVEEPEVESFTPPGEPQSSSNPQLNTATTTSNLMETEESSTVNIDADIDSFISQVVQENSGNDNYMAEIGDEDDDYVP